MAEKPETCAARLAEQMGTLTSQDPVRAGRYWKCVELTLVLMSFVSQKVVGRRWREMDLAP